MAGHQWLAGSNGFMVVGRWMRVTFFLVFGAYVLTAYAVLRRYLPVGYAQLAAGVCLLNPFTHFLSDLCFAEIPFALATTVFGLVNGWEHRRGWSVAAGMCAIAAYLLRTIGIALFVAWILDALLRRRFRTAAVRLVITVVPVVGWQASA